MGTHIQSRMKIVLLAVDDEFAGEMQRFLHDALPDWIVGPSFRPVRFISIPDSTRFCLSCRSLGLCSLRK